MIAWGPLLDIITKMLLNYLKNLYSIPRRLPLEMELYSPLPLKDGNFFLAATKYKIFKPF